MLFSVIIPTHNRGVLVKRAVRSVLESGLADGEIIVAEDRSDAAAEVLATEIAEGSIRYIKNSGDVGGASVARNLGVSIARGTYVLFLDDDDRLLPHYLESLQAHWKTTTADWGFGLQIIDGQTLRRRDHWDRELQTGQLGKRLGMRPRICASSAGMWIRRATFTTLGGFRVGQTVDEDTDLCCRLLAEAGDPFFLKMPAVELNRDGQEVRLTNAVRQTEVAQSYMQTFQSNYSACRALPGARWFLASRALRQLVRVGDMPQARKAIAEVPDLGVRMRLSLKLTLAQAKQRRRGDKPGNFTPET